jgi:hypothetical protein
MNWHLARPPKSFRGSLTGIGSEGQHVQGLTLNIETIALAKLDDTTQPLTGVPQDIKQQFIAFTPKALPDFGELPLR